MVGAERPVRHPAERFVAELVDRFEQLLKSADSPFNIRRCRTDLSL
jgi:hypothetical protein